MFEKIQARLGGRVRFLASGSSPISSNIMEFLRTCFCPLIEGYGMTEAGCSITTTHPGDTVLSHVGAPIACFEVKLVRVRRTPVLKDRGTVTSIQGG